MRAHGHARISWSNPEPSGECDRCGFRYTLSDLNWQHDWAGTKLVNKQWRVCDRCLDEPSNKNRTIFLKPDPVPVKDPRPVAWADQEPNFFTTEDGNFRFVTEDGLFNFVAEGGGPV